MIARLRKLGGQWSAIRSGFGWRYEGYISGHEYDVRSYAYLAPCYPGDDDTFDVRWIVRKDGRELGSTKSPDWLIMRDLERIWSGEL